jgi:hypothetical protein
VESSARWKSLSAFRSSTGSASIGRGASRPSTWQGDADDQMNGSSPNTCVGVGDVCVRMYMCVLMRSRDVYAFDRAHAHGWMDT